MALPFQDNIYLPGPERNIRGITNHGRDVVCDVWTVSPFHVESKAKEAGHASSALIRVATQQYFTSAKANSNTAISGRKPGLFLSG